MNTNNMLDLDTISYIKSFLKSCYKCEKYHIYINNRYCCICKNYVCVECNMIMDYSEYEVRMLYCMPCHKMIFQ